jgi:hypothetical protein
MTSVLKRMRRFSSFITDRCISSLSFSRRPGPLPGLALKPKIKFCVQRSVSFYAATNSDKLSDRRMSGQIFISYRRSDSLGSTGRLYDHLIEHFAPERIFMDVDTIAPGIDFVEAIEQAVSKCDVLIAVIGAGWLQSSDNQGRRRLGDPGDIVRLEIGNALKRKIRVIPVLVENALMPSAGDLPDELKPLTRRNALELSHTRYKADVERLINALEQALELAKVQGAVAEKAEAEHISAGDAGAQNMVVGKAMPVVRVGEKGQAEQQAAKQAGAKQIVTEEPGQVLFTCKAGKRWMFSVHRNCQFIVRTTDVDRFRQRLVQGAFGARLEGVPQ